MVEPTAVNIHVRELGPEQSEVRECRRYVRQIERDRLLRDETAVAVLVIVAVGEAVAREQHPLARIKTPPGRAQVADHRLDRHQATAAEIDLITLLHPAHAMLVLWERKMVIADIPA